MQIWCCQCCADVEARLTDGAEIYPHRPDLAAYPYWRCDTCQNHVGTHHKTNDPTKPLGNIPSKELRTARTYMHELIDPPWRSSDTKRRRAIYSHLSKKLVRPYHTAELRSLAEARDMYAAARDFIRSYDKVDA